MYFLIMLGDWCYHVARNYLSWTITLLSGGFHSVEEKVIFATGAACTVNIRQIKNNKKRQESLHCLACYF